MSDRLLEETTALLPMQNGGKVVVLCESILKLQDTKTDRLSREDERREMAEWLGQPCPHYEHWYRWRCPYCTEELYIALREGRRPLGG